jgi:hypothetical protein
MDIIRREKREIERAKEEAGSPRSLEKSFPEKKAEEEGQEPEPLPLLPLTLTAQDRRKFENMHWSDLWRDMLKDNESLLHVDFSQNNLNVEDIVQFAEGLKSNHTLLGIHFQGNEGDVDSQGFVKPNIPLLKVGSTIPTRIRPDLKAGIIDDLHMKELEIYSKCWICEGWTEHTFTFTPGTSEISVTKHDPFKPIKLHIDFDEYEGDLMVPKPSNPCVYELTRMLPPGTTRYFFTHMGRVVVARD